MNKTNKYILSIDLGTSGPKVALVSTQGEVVDYEFEKTRFFLVGSGGVEQRPQDWWDAIIQAAKRLLRQGVVSLDEIVALCCTSQWSGTVAVDRDGNPLMNAIIWMDSRGAPHIRSVARGLINVEGYGITKLARWLRLTGGVPGPSGKDPIAHILYIKNKLPEIYRQTYQLLEPKDYINLRLTGKFAASYDSIILHWLTDNRDISNIVYDNRLLKMAGIDKEKLPELKRAVDILGPLKPEVAEELGLNKNVPVIVGSPDVQSAAIGSGAVRDYEAHLYIGTSSWLTCHVPFKKVDLIHKIASLPSAIPNKYFVANEQESAGACLNFLKDNILFDKDESVADNQADYKVFDQIAERVPAGSNRVIFSPWLNGERAPVENGFVRGGFFNLSLDTTREHMVKAVYEGVAYNSKWLLKYVEKFVRRRFDAINIIGGGARSDIWCQIYADVLNRTIRQVQDPILANVRGAAFLAAISLRELTFDDIPGRVPIRAAYKPDRKNRTIYDELFREFVNLYKGTRGIYRRLNR
ncbi:MAG: FGGY-family carbohydrate kinase [bacterium]